MKKMGYDGKSTLGLQKQGILEPIQPTQTQKVPSLGYDAQKDKTLSTACASSKEVESSNATQTNEESAINDFIEIYDYDSVPTPEPNHNICTLESIQNLDSNHDSLPLVHLELIDFDQKGPPQLDVFENDEAIIKFIGA